MKLHLFRQHGYWNARMDGIHGAGYSQRQALTSWLMAKRFWLRESPDSGF